MSNYLRVCMLVLLVLLCLAALTNYLVNPYHFFSDSLLRLEKRPLFHSLYISKPYQLREMEPQALILGSSRPANAFRGDHSAWDGLRVYNAGFPATRTSHMDFALQLAEGSGELDRVLVALDFYMFLNDDMGVPTTAQIELEQRLTVRSGSVEYWLRRIQDTLYVALGWPVLTDSFRTSLAQSAIREGREEGLTLLADGQWRTSAHRAAYDRTAFMANLRQATALYCAISAQFVQRGSQLEYSRYEVLLERLYASEIRVDFVMMPMHGALLQVLERCGLQPALEQWKRQIVIRNQAWADRHSRSTLQVWDFSAYNAITMADLPAKDRPMRWFYDASHPSEKAGDLMLSIIYEEQENTGFGTVIHADNIEEQLLQSQQAGVRYGMQMQRQLGPVTKWARAVLMR